MDISPKLLITATMEIDEYVLDKDGGNISFDEMVEGFSQVPELAVANVPELIAAVLRQAITHPNDPPAYIEATSPEPMQHPSGAKITVKTRLVFGS